MTDKPTPPPRRKVKTPLDLNMIKTLIASGFTLDDISVQLGKAKQYLSQMKKTNEALAAVIDQAKADAKEGLNYEMIETLSGQGCTQDQISLALGYGAQYLTQRKPNDEQLREAIDRGNAKGICKMTGKIFEMGMKENLGAAIFYLKNKAGWKDKVEMDAQINNYYMEGRPETQDIDSWQQQYSPAPTTRQ